MGLWDKSMVIQAQPPFKQLSVLQLCLLPMDAVTSCGCLHTQGKEEVKAKREKNILSPRRCYSVIVTKGGRYMCNDEEGQRWSPTVLTWSFLSSYNILSFVLGHHTMQGGSILVLPPIFPLLSPKKMRKRNIQSLSHDLEWIFITVLTKKRCSFYLKHVYPPIGDSKRSMPWSCMGWRSRRIDLSLWHWVLSVYTQYKLHEPFSLCIGKCLSFPSIAHVCVLWGL